MLYISDLNLKNARKITKEFDQAVSGIDWISRITVEAIRAKMDWPWYGFASKDPLVRSLSWIFDHVINPMLTARGHIDTSDPVYGLHYHHGMVWSFKTWETLYPGDFGY